MGSPETSVTETKYLLHRRFDRLGRLIGDANMEKLFRSHVMIIGLGGVGGWAAESLARSGVGRLTLVDFDDICVTNTNRQIQAMQSQVGEKKALVLAERLRKINPQLSVDAIVDFYREDNSEFILARRPDWVFDCIDNITAKCHLLAACRRSGLRVITSGGAGGRIDPLKIRCVDMSETAEDPMLQQVRKVLRQKYEFPRTGAFEVPCVYSEEPMHEPIDLKYDQGKGFRCVCPQGKNDFHSCEKRNIIYGTASFLTGSFGFAMAAHVVQQLIKQGSVE
jgi:tRNA A37 threonylcarbamoyladenosine dehydratase